MELRSSQVLAGRIARPEPCIATSVSLPLGRVANIDRLRVVAAAGIVWFHTDAVPHREIGHAGLPIFLMIFFALITRRSPVESTAHFLKRRWDRLIVPWLFWFVVYGLCKVGKAITLMDMESLSAMLSMETLVAGTHIHLWYLPYAFVSGLVIHAVNGRTLGINNGVVIFAATVLGVFALMTHALSVFGRELMAPLPQWSYGLAAIPLGFAIGRCMMIPSRETQRSMLLAVALIVLGACVILSSAGFRSLALAYGLATSLVCIACAWPSRDDAFVRCVAPLTCGIYLIHPLVSYGVRHSIAPDEHYIALFLSIVCVSGLTAYILMKTPLRRFV